MINADYNTALSTLLHYPALPVGQRPSSLVEDANALRRNLDTDTGSSLIFKHTKKSPKSREKPTPISATPTRSSRQERIQPDLRSPHLLPPPRPSHHPSNSFEAVLQNAARSVYSSGERLGVNKAVRDAVGDVRKNVQSIRSDLRSRTHSRSVSIASTTEENSLSIERRFENLQLRNKSLAKMLEGAVSELWKQQKEMAVANTNKPSSESDERVKSLTIAIARVQLAQVYLEDPELPLPEDEIHSANKDVDDVDARNEILFAAPEESPVGNMEPSLHDLAQSPPQASPGAEDASFYFHQSPTRKTPQPAPAKTENVEKPAAKPPLPQPQFSLMLGQESGADVHPAPEKASKNPSVRPSIEESSFSWMLGQEKTTRERSSTESAPFTSSVDGRGSLRKHRDHGNTAFLFGEPNDDSPSTAPRDAKAKKDDLF